jgi:1-acyl-sn-glycerol-3-phosphate acyltransferase
MVIMTHKAFWDPVIAGMIFDRPLRFMAKKELFVNTAAAKFITSLGAFPIDRGAGDRAALTAALDMLKRGEMLLMFPEGHRQRYHGVGDFLPGVGMIALRSGAPVIPLALDGTQDMLRDGKLGLPALRGLVGPPVDLSDITTRNSKAYQEAARRMHEAMAGLYARL